MSGNLNSGTDDLLAQGIANFEWECRDNHQLCIWKCPVCSTGNLQIDKWCQSPYRDENGVLCLGKRPEHWKHESAHQWYFKNGFIEKYYIKPAWNELPNGPSIRS